LLKKIFIGIVGAGVVIAFISWEAAVAIHDRTSGFDSRGNLSTLLDLLALDTGKKAKAAYDKGDYETARKLYLKRAQHGNSDAMLPLAFMYSQGKGGPLDNIQAVRWFRVLADRGDPAAQFGMGVSYATGSGVEQDYPEALRWYQKSARQGSLGARTNLGVMYLNGQGVSADRIEAQKWFILAAKTGQENRTALPAALTPDENALAEKRAGEWRPNR